MKVGIACDHRGYKLKEKLKKYLTKKGYEVLDLGTNSPESCDYSDYGIALGEKVRDKEVEFGIAVCGTGIGISIACNKVKGIRCARITNSRDAKETRIHNNANIVALNEKLFFFEAKDIVDTFLNTKYVADERFERRINKMLDYEGK